MVSKRAKIIAIAIIAVVVIVSIYVWQSAPAFPEAEKATNSFIDALNKYDADAAWALMSSGLQSSYKSKANFDSSVLEGLRESFWHVSGTSVNDRSVETSNNLTTACFIVLLKVFYYEPYGRHYGLPTTGLSDMTYTFKLVKIGDQWQIDDWYPSA
jgi:L-asparagine transporter-like permease